MSYLHVQYGNQWQNWPCLNFVCSLDIPFIPILCKYSKTRKLSTCNTIGTKDISGCFLEIELFIFDAMAEYITSDEVVRVELTATDIPGADLSEPLEGNGIPALKW